MEKDFKSAINPSGGVNKRKLANSIKEISGITNGLTSKSNDQILIATFLGILSRNIDYKYLSNINDIVSFENFPSNVINFSNRVAKGLVLNNNLENDFREINICLNIVTAIRVFDPVTFNKINQYFNEKCSVSDLEYNSVFHPGFEILAFFMLHVTPISINKLLNKVVGRNTTNREVVKLMDHQDIFIHESEKSPYSLYQKHPIVKLFIEAFQKVVKKCELLNVKSNIYIK